MQYQASMIWELWVLPALENRYLRYALLATVIVLLAKKGCSARVVEGLIRNPPGGKSVW